MDSRLDRIQVAAPCPAKWEAMTGDERSRHCEQCDLRVYNVSGMKRAEAEAFVNAAEGRTCVRFFRRADGTILTDDCPVGLAARAKRTVRRAAAFVCGILGLGLIGGAIERKLREPPVLPPVAGIMICPPTPPTPPGGNGIPVIASDDGTAPPTSGSEGSEPEHPRRELDDSRLEVK